MLDPIQRPILTTPTDLWQQQITLGQACRRIRRTVLSVDPLVAALALHHNAVLMSFDPFLPCQAQAEGFCPAVDRSCMNTKAPDPIEP